jgi:hypothetical protein
MAHDSPSWLQRIFGKGSGETVQTEVPTGNAVLAPPPTDRAAAQDESRVRDREPSGEIEQKHVAATSIDEIIRIEEVSDAEFFIGDLFRRRFHCDPPNYPRSFVAFYQPVRGRLEAVGFVHYLVHEDSYLCGGLVIDERRYRQMPPEHRKMIKEAGGISEKLLRVTFARLSHAPAIWGYVGDALAEKVDLRAGFRHTNHPRIMVYWTKDLPADEKERRLAKVVALGPF